MAEVCVRVVLLCVFLTCSRAKDKPEAFPLALRCPPSAVTVTKTGLAASFTLALWAIRLHKQNLRSKFKNESGQASLGMHRPLKLGD